MKTIALLALSALASSAFAGQPVVMDSKKVVIPPEPCFGETEFQLDAFGAYTFNPGRDGIGGGLALSYYFHRNIGARLDFDASSARTTTVSSSADLLFRYPVELGGLCLAPYATVGGGYRTGGGNRWFYSAGGGLELRLTPKVGIFGEGAYNWANGATNFTQVRAGVRFVF